MEFHPAALTTCDRLCAKVLRHAGDRTSCEEESTPMNVDVFGALKRKESEVLFKQTSSPL